MDQDVHNKDSKDDVGDDSNEDVASVIEIDDDSNDDDSDDSDEEPISIKRGETYPVLFKLFKNGECDTVQVKKEGQKRTDVYAMRNKKQRRLLKQVIEDAGPEIISWTAWSNALGKGHSLRPNNADDARNAEKKKTLQKTTKGKLLESTKGKKNDVLTKKKQGKATKEVDDEFDDDCIDFSGQDAIDMKKLLDAKGQKPVQIFLSRPFKSEGGKSHWVVIFGDNGKAFFLKPEHLRDLFHIGWHKKHPLKPLPTWISSLDCYNIRAMEHGKDSKWYKTKGNKTRTRMALTFSLPTSEDHTVHELLKRDLQVIFSLMKKRPMRPAGTLALQYIEKISGGTDRGLYKYLTDKHNGDFERTAHAMTDDLHDHFKDGMTFIYDNSLDKYMVDWDIKQFVEKYLGCNSWDDLSENDKQSAYKNYPKRKLPDWSNIREESY